GGLAQTAPGTHPVWLNNSAASRRVAIIVTQQPAQAIATPYLAAVAPKAWLGCNELIAEALMIPLGMIMRQILLDHIEQRLLARQEHRRQGFLLDRAHKPFTVGVQIGTPR